MFSKKENILIINGLLLSLSMLTVYAFFYAFHMANVGLIRCNRKLKRVTRVNRVGIFSFAKCFIWKHEDFIRVCST